jgi:putative membrane protein
MLPTGNVMVAAGNRLLRSTLVHAADNARSVDAQLAYINHVWRPRLWSVACLVTTPSPPRHEPQITCPPGWQPAHRGLASRQTDHQAATTVERDRPADQKEWVAMMMGGWLFMVLLPILVLALVIWALSASGRTLWARGDQTGKQRSALQLLEERFARGEIDRQEFEQRREILAQR